MGVSVIGEQGEDSFIFLNNVEIVGNTVYFTIDYARADGSWGWRPVYGRNHSKFCKCEIGNPVVDVVYEY